MKLSQLVQAGAFATIAVFGSAHAATNLITNGDFENFAPFTGYVTLNAGATSLAGWTVGDTSVDVINGGYGAISGNSIDMLGTPGPGSLAQTFATVAGGYYSLAFDLARNPSDSSLLTVSFGGTDSYTFTGTTTPTHYTQLFQALGNSTTLSFASAQVALNGGAVLDNVSVSAVPEPSTYALMLGGLGLMGFMARRRKQA